MKTIKNTILITATALSLLACKKAPTIDNTNTQKIENSNTTGASQKHDDIEVANIKNFINKSILTEADKKVIPNDERKFRYQDVDLNNDGRKETFVFLDSNYFCGTGGCTILLLSQDKKLITKFTVTRPPIFVEPTLENGWKILSVKSGGEWKKLAYDGAKYPSNPSVVKKAPYDAPSGHAEIIFQDGGNLKTYEF